MITIRPAANSQELEQWYALRFKEYCVHHRYLDPANYPSKQEYDKYDLFSDHILVFSEDQVIGGCRLISPKPCYLMEEQFKLPSDIDRNKMVEISRVLMDSSWRGHKLYLHLLRAGYGHSKRVGKTHWCGTLTVDVNQALQRFGWRFTYLSQTPIQYHGADVLPFILLLDDEHVRLPKTSPDIVCV